VNDQENVEAPTLWGLLVERARLTPDRLALSDQRGIRLSFEELRARSERVAAGLLALGIVKGTRFAWQLPTCADAVVLSMALCRLGAVQVPIISLYREREVSFLLEETQARWIAIPRVWRGFDYQAMVSDILEQGELELGVLVVDDGLPDGDPGTLGEPPSDPDAIRWLYSTSGTTSHPKIVQHADATLVAGGTGIAVAIQPQPDDVASVPFPYAHIGGPDQMVMSLQRGIPQVLIELFVPTDVMPLLRDEHVSIIGGSTAHYIAMLQEQAKSSEPVLASLRVMVGGGAPKPPELYWRAKAELGVEIRHGYGMTECPMIASGAAGDTDEQLASSEGAPVKSCEVRIVDGSGSPVVSGVDGEVEVRGPMLFKGYLDPEQNAVSFCDDGFFKTGDRGHLRSDGHIVLTGRSKEIIIRKGENISPREIEDILATHPSVGAVAVIGLPDAERGERVCAVIETNEGRAPLTLGQVQQLCRDSGLMVQKIPEQVECVDALPRNPTMKILKRELVERYS